MLPNRDTFDCRIAPLAVAIALCGCGNAKGMNAEPLTAAAAMADDMNVLAICGQSDGHAYFVNAATGDGEWSNDPTTGGRVVFARDGNGKLHVIYRTAGQGSVDEADDGGQIIEIPGEAETDVRAVVTYPGDGVMITYNVRTAPDGQRSLLWTVNRAAKSTPVKAGAYVSQCIS